jgi:hypothetical protein
MANDEDVDRFHPLSGRPRPYKARVRRRPATGDRRPKSHSTETPEDAQEWIDGMIRAANGGINRPRPCAIGGRANSRLKMTFRALRKVSLNPWRIGKIVAAAMVILHIGHDRTT